MTTAIWWQLKYKQQLSVRCTAREDSLQKTVFCQWPVSSCQLGDNVLDSCGGFPGHFGRKCLLQEKPRTRSVSLIQDTALQSDHRLVASFPLIRAAALAIFHEGWIWTRSAHRRTAGVSQNDPWKRTRVGHSLEPRPQFHEKTLQREMKDRKLWRRRGKTRNFGRSSGGPAKAAATQQKQQHRSECSST